MMKRLFKYLAATGGKTRLFLNSIISVHTLRAVPDKSSTLFNEFLRPIELASHEKETFSLHAYNSILYGNYNILLNRNSNVDSQLSAQTSTIGNYFRA